MWWIPTYNQTQHNDIDEVLSISAIPGRVKIELKVKNEGETVPTLTLHPDIVDQLISKLTKAKEAAKVME